jgi:hypothetical protein
MMSLKIKNAKVVTILSRFHSLYYAPIVAGVISGLLLSYLLRSDGPPVGQVSEVTPTASISSPLRTDVAVEADFSVSDAELMYDYLRDETAADRKYKGKVLNIAGVVSHVGKYGDEVFLEAGTEDSRSIQCRFSRSFKCDLRLLEGARKVLVQGRCDGALLHYDITINNCTLLTPDLEAEQNARIIGELVCVFLLAIPFAFLIIHFMNRR